MSERTRVTVQRGEGTIEIIYGSTSIPSGAIVHGGYLARPDGIGEWPTVLVFGPQPTPTSSIKNLCRVFARHGIAALAPELTESHRENRRIAQQVAAFMADPAGHWSNAQFGYGALAFGPGAYDAAGLATDDARLSAIGMVSVNLDDTVVEDLRIADVPAIVIDSRGDASTDVDASVGRQDALPRTTFVIYPDAETAWWDDDAPGYDETRATDTVDRLIGFFGDQLPPRI